MLFLVWSGGRFNSKCICFVCYVYVDNFDERIEEVIVYSDGCIYLNRMLC